MPRPSWCCGQKAEEGAREIHVNSGEKHHPYKDNRTSTTKYSLLTFLPKALFEQYRRVANVYFTIVAVLSLTQFSPVRPWTTWTPLAIVMGVSMIKEAIEDYKRAQADKEVNNRLVDVLDVSTRTFVPKKWRQIVPGEIVRVKKDEYFPTDLLFLASSSEEGTCYVETMNLDGETNLKIKKAPDETKGMSAEAVADFKATIHCEPPNVRLYQFAGNMLLDPPFVPAPAKLPISPAAVLLRGCSLRNTEYILGATIYAGHETKVFMNSTEPPSKRSVIERKVDKIIYFMFGLNFSFCITGCIYFAEWLNKNFTEHWYLYPQDQSTQYQYENKALVGVCNFITGFILYGYLIPISLYVSIEMVKITQSMVFMAKDREMYHAETDTPALARTSNLNEDLGMVTTVLSDKTGTLTRNMMDFFKCSIAGTSYGAGVTEIEKSNAERKGITLPPIDIAAAEPYRERFFNFYDARLMSGAWYKSPDAPTIEMFFRLLAVCHTVIPDGPPDEKTIKYEAESPDEAALVVAAKVMGFFCCRRTNKHIYVRENTPSGSAEVEYEMLNVLEFNSTRKRMSVIVRDSFGKLIIFCKGADTVIYERLDNKHPGNATYKEPTSQQMEDFGSSGLRTLCLSYNELDPAEYAKWEGKWNEAKMMLEGREEVLQALMEEVEKNLRLLGCTAIEDKLQDGVPRCIKNLADAGVRLWVLTGDKMETAINIGFACSLITEEMQQFIISAYFKEVDELEEAGDMEGAARLACAKVEEQLEQVSIAIAAARDKYDFALVIDGKALSYALGEKLHLKFLAVGIKCKAVLCCRVSPLQKAQVTRLVKVKGGNVTLAIGDGANDVGMIQEAHIGVGISGQEGMQAVMASDFAIAQFRFLTPLLLVHGRLSYKRITRMVAFFFFKNLLFGITLFAFNGFTTFSGQYVYNDVYMTLYNVVFTSVTPIVIGMFDRDLDRDISLKFPQLYRQGQDNTYLNLWSVAGWLGSALYQCAIVFALTMVGNQPTLIDRSGGDPFTMYQTGITMYSVIILTVHLEISSIEEQWTWIHHASIWGSQIIWWLFLILFNYLPLSISADLYHLFIGIVAPCPQYWLYCLLLPVAAVLPDFFYRSVRRWVSPSEHHIVGEVQYLEQQRLKKEGPEEIKGSSKATAAAAVKIFEEKKHTRNSGFVPPYDPKSRFYSFMKGPKAAASASLAHAGNTRDDTVVNPVLAHLDQELTNNPYRGVREAVTPAMGIPITGGSSSEPRSAAALSSPTAVAKAPNGSVMMMHNPLSEMQRQSDSEMISTYTAALK